jgi:casein kinase 1
MHSGNGHMNGSESFLYGQPQTGKNESGSREETTIAGTGQRELGGQVRAMGMFDREQMQRVGEQDEDGGHGRKGFWSALCCRT